MLQALRPLAPQRNNCGDRLFAGAIFGGYGSLNNHGEKRGQIEAVCWVAPGLRICGQAKADGAHNLSALVDCSKAVLLVAIP